MKTIQDTLKTYTIEKKGATSERADLIGRFHTKLNQERKGTKWKPLSVKFVAVKLGHLSVSDLYFFWKRCNEGEFGKIFFGALKNK
jgi:hypothetical protein